MGVKFVVMDVDGTLLTSKNTITQKTSIVLRDAVGKGIRIGLCSGRMLQSIYPICDIIGGEISVVAYNGAMIATYPEKKVTFFKALNPSVVQEIVKISKTKGFHLNLYIDDELYVNVVNEYVERYAEKYGVSFTVIKDLATVVNGNVPKLLVICKPEDRDKLFSLLRQCYPDGELHITSSASNHIEILDASVGKDKALEKIITQFGITPEEVIAFGDNMNDVDMLRWAGRGVAMANAEDGVKSIADDIAGSNDKDGVACYLTGVLG